MKKESHILLVDDHPVYRQGLHNLLEKEKDLKVVGEASDGAIAIDLVRELSPDIVIMDITMPNLDGIEATQQIVSKSPHTNVVALSVHSEKRFVRGMLKAGAKGYILKECVYQEMLQGIRTILSGSTFLCQSVSSTVLADYSSLLPEEADIIDIPSVQVLETKLHRPSVTADIIPRMRLIELLEAGRDRVLSLISAPAGYGKSVLASQWLASCSCQSAWLSLDDNENDLREFLRYFVAALHKAYPSALLKSRALLQLSKLPKVEILSRYLVDDLDQVEKPFILVLDDYHVIRNEAVHELLMGTLRPPLPGYHIVLIARRDPPLPLMQLRAYGLLNEITVKDLRFTNEETVDFLERNLRFQVERDLAEAIEKKLEGWVTGLRLAAISLSGKKDSAKIVEGLRENTRYVYDYLIEEVLATIPKRYSRFLLSTSILDRFCAPLCEDLLSLTEKTKEKGFTGQAFIDWLEAAHMFVIHLDDKHNWFRYHHLFQEMLQDRLKSTEDPDTVASLHSRAGKWFAENDFIDDALRHSIAGGDVPAAVQLFEQNRMNALSHDRWYVFEKWLSLFPEEIVQTQPALLIARAWLHAERHEFPLVLPILDTIESLIENTRQDKTLLAEMDLLRGDYYSLCENDIPRSLKHLQKALDLVPEQEPFIRGHIELGWALGSQMQGKKDAAVKLLQEGLQTESEASNIRPTRLLAGLTYIHVISAELEEAIRFNRQLHNYSLKHDFMFAFSWSVYLQGLIHFYRNEINDAIACFLRLNDFRFRAHGRAVLDGLAGLVLAYEAAGQPEQADRSLQDLYDYVDSLGEPAYALYSNSCRARLSLLRGNPEPGLEWIRRSAPPTENMLFWLDIPAENHCRTLLADGAGASLEKAEKKLTELLEQNQKFHNTCHTISIFAMLAVVYQKQAKTEQASAAAEQAVTLAHPGNFIRPFLELGPPMVEILRHLRRKKVAQDFIERILVAFEKQSQARVPQSESAPQAPPPTAQPSRALWEDLTQRELDVLTCLEKGMSNKEIGAELFLSALTVKKHLYNIFQKLNVHTRLEAVKKARESGLLARD